MSRLLITKPGFTGGRLTEKPRPPALPEGVAWAWTLGAGIPHFAQTHPLMQGARLWGRGMSH